MAPASSERRLLALNAGSSSLKFAVFAVADPSRARIRGRISGIGRAEVRLTARDAGGHERADEHVDARDHRSALTIAWRWLEQRRELDGLAAVGHRLVHGGPQLAAPCRVTAEVLGELQRAIDFAPQHLPAGIMLLEAVRDRCVELPQIACFDTWFHRDLPKLARLLPLPRRFEAQGIRRYGFHGLSYEFILHELDRLEPRLAREGRVVIAHLGNGASLAAVRAGRGIDTSMGATPAGGIPMSTRTGDLDPGVVALLAGLEGMDVARFNHVVNRESGLLGLSETSADLRQLMAVRVHDPRADEAIAFFCYQVKKWIGGFAAALGGLDLLVLTGGVGENLAPVRAEICGGLEFLGLHLDAAANDVHGPVLSAADSRVRVLVIPTDEEQMIARAVCRLLGWSAQP